MPRLCIVLTVPFTLNAFVRPHLERLVHIFDVTVCVNMRNAEIPPMVPDRVRLHQLDIERPISPLADMVTAWQLLRVLRAGKFDMVLSMTPKGGLLAMGCAVLSGIPSRMHCFTGQVWATRTGLARAVLKRADAFIARCATRVLTDSRSQRDFLVMEGVVGPEKIEVLANGSMAGVDVERFRPDSLTRARVRADLGLEAGALCILFVGRLTKEKGIPELLLAFARLAVRHAHLHLLLVGPDEQQVSTRFDAVGRIHCVGYSTEVERYMAAADILCLPSHREGFGLVLVEAGAVGLPVVASRICGVTDAVVDGVTGLLHEPGNVHDLERKLATLIDDASLRVSFGEAGLRRARENFRSETVTFALERILRHELESTSTRQA